MDYLMARDTISGQEGRAFATIEGKVEPMFYAKNVEATVKKNKAEVKTLGRRVVQHKAAGWTGEGKMTIYTVTSTFRKIMLNYMKSGVDTYFDIMVVNDDPASSIGKQTVILKGVNLDEVVMAKLDTESDVLEEEVSFTFEDVDLMDSFSAPKN